MSAKDVLVGRKFGRLTVIADEPKVRDIRMIRCRCDCGGIVVVQARKAKAGWTQSCGCLRRETTGNRARSHGLSKHPLFSTWKQIRGRTMNPTNHAFKHYGGRGITVCNRWKASFKSFLEDVGERPSPRHTLHRIDNDGAYSPNNVVWANWTVQQRNTRRSRKLSFNGRTLGMTEWSEHTGIPYRALLARVNNGWTAERALTTPTATSSKSARA